MKSRRPLIRFSCLSLFLATILTSCGGGDSWFLGTWEVDVEKTKAELMEDVPDRVVPEPPAEEPANLEEMGQQLGNAMQDMADGLAKGLKGALGTMLVQQMQGVRIIVEGNQITSVGPGGSGESHSFEVIDQPDSDTLIIKKADGEVSTWRREPDGYISTAASGGGDDLRVFFRPAEE